MTLDIPIDVCPVTVRMRRPVRRLEVWWPILRMDQWAKLLFNQKPQLLLGGQVPDPQGKWKKLYYDFWSVYQNIHGDHPIFSRKDVDMGTCLPYMIHGDEGRGQLKRPYLVVSWQLLIGHNGLQATNDSGYHGVYSGDRHFLFLFHEWCHFKPLSQWNLANPWWKKFRHSFTSRFLFSGVSSHLYYQDWTVDDLLGELAKQAIDAYEVGVLEPWIEYSQRFFKNLTEWLIIDIVHMCTY